MHERGSVETLAVEIVTRDETILFRRFRPFVTFEVIQNNVHLWINTEKDHKICVGNKYSVWQ